MIERSACRRVVRWSVARATRATEQDQQLTFSQVRRQGLEPRTRGLRVDRWAAANALPARIAHVNAPEACNTRTSGRYPFHDPFHGPMADTAGMRHGESPVSRPANRRAFGCAGCTVREAIRRSGAVVALWPPASRRGSVRHWRKWPDRGDQSRSGRRSISCTVIAGAAHDHLFLFVDWLSDIALALIRQL